VNLPCGWISLFFMVDLLVLYIFLIRGALLFKSFLSHYTPLHSLDTHRPLFNQVGAKKEKQQTKLHITLKKL
jgi:hypothetical protein